MHHRIADLDFRDLVSPACQLITNQSDAADVVARSINPGRLWLVVPRLVHDFPVASHWHQRVAWLQQLPRTSRGWLLLMGFVMLDVILLFWLPTLLASPRTYRLVVPGAVTLLGSR